MDDLGVVIRMAEKKDLDDLLRLCSQFRDDPIPEKTSKLIKTWKEILSASYYHVFVAQKDQTIVSSLVLLIIPNLTHGQRPYAVIENVITDKDFRNHGIASALLSAARERAKEQNCYKIMLMTGSKTDSTLRFYEKAGYNRNDKTAFIQWLE
jgi:ribosomal protein S18 acetylase RimI-like enzyme